MNPPKNPGVAAVLSFFWTGLGQIYNGRIGKGLLFAALQFINALSMFVLIGFITFPIFWIWGMVDAYGEAEEINERSRDDLVPGPISISQVAQQPAKTIVTKNSRFLLVLNFFLLGILIFYLLYPSWVLKHRYQLVSFFQSIFQEGK